MKRFKKKLYKRVSIDPGISSIGVYRIYKENIEFFLVVFEYKAWSVPLGEGYTPWGAVAKATLSPIVKDNKRLQQALAILEKVII